MNTLWINRIIAIIVYLISVYICERFKLSPWLCFTVAVFMLLGLSFIFAIIDEVLK